MNLTKEQQERLAEIKKAYDNPMLGFFAHKKMTEELFVMFDAPAPLPSGGKMEWKNIIDTNRGEAYMFGDLQFGAYSIDKENWARFGVVLSRNSKQFLVKSENDIAEAKQWVEQTVAAELRSLGVADPVLIKLLEDGACIKHKKKMLDFYMPTPQSIAPETVDFRKMSEEMLDSTYGNYDYCALKNREEKLEWNERWLRSFSDRIQRETREVYILLEDSDGTTFSVPKPTGEVTLTEQAAKDWASKFDGKPFASRREYKKATIIPPSPRP